MHCTKCGLESTVCCCLVYGERKKPTAVEVYHSQKEDCEPCEGKGEDAYRRICQECDGWGKR